MAPTLGRDFLPQEFDHAPQAPGFRASTENRGDTGIAILSDRLFRRLGGTPAILGTLVVISNIPYTVVGVLPAGFRLPVAPSLQLGIGPQTDIDVVLNTTMSRTSRGPGAALARLKPGVAIETAVAELEGLRMAANQARGKDESSSGLSLADILRLILSNAAALVVTGVAIGIGGSAALSRLIGGVLYGVSPTDPFAYVMVSLLLIAVALIAAYLPARRAMRLDPMMALRRE